MKKYVVHITGTYYIEADSEQDAWDKATNNVYDYLYMDYAEPIEVKDYNHLGVIK